MQAEVEAKFLNVSFDDICEKLTELGADCEQPMRLMRRVAIENDYMRSGKDSFLRIRDEGNRVTMTYKQFDDLSVDGAKEIEVEVSDYEATIAILEQAGLPAHTAQETRRETWRLGDVEIMLDEWPWLNPYIEIESGSEEAVRHTAEQMGFNWGDAVFGDVMAAYRAQYPHLSPKDTIGTVPVVRFDLPLPDLLKS
jgi:adenylate cyclase, class 2